MLQNGSESPTKLGNLLLARSTEEAPPLQQ